MAIQIVGLRPELSSFTRHCEKWHMVLIRREEMPGERA